MNVLFEVLMICIFKRGVGGGQCGIWAGGI